MGTVKLLCVGITCFYAGALLLIVGILVFERPRRKHNTQQEGINHDYSNFEEDFYRGGHHHQAGNRLVPNPPRPAQTGPVVEVTAPNENGEIPGYGAAWSCADFGKPGHNYFLCIECNENFRLWIRQSAQQRRAA